MRLLEWRGLLRGGPAAADLSGLGAVQRRVAKALTAVLLILGTGIAASGYVAGRQALDAFSGVCFAVWVGVFGGLWLITRRPSSQRYVEPLLFVVGLALVGFMALTPWLALEHDSVALPLVVSVPLTMAMVSLYHPGYSLALSVAAVSAVLGMQHLLGGDVAAYAVEIVPFGLACGVLAAFANVWGRVLWAENVQGRRVLAAEERMASLGRLTAGLAHELKTPIAATDNALVLIRELGREMRSSVGNPTVEEDDWMEMVVELTEAAALAEKANARVAGFVKAIRTRTQPTVRHAPKPFALRERLAPLESLLGHRFRRAGVTLDVSVPPALEVEGDPAKLDQVLTNLVQNALDAIEESGVGAMIWVEAHRHKQEVVIAVEDDGPGIDEVMRDRVFDYLFTTRDATNGTGIGLALCRDIVGAEFGGEIAATDPRRTSRGARIEMRLRAPTGLLQQPAAPFEPAHTRATPARA